MDASNNPKVALQTSLPLATFVKNGEQPPPQRSRSFGRAVEIPNATPVKVVDASIPKPIPTVFAALDSHNEQTAPSKPILRKCHIHYIHVIILFILLGGLGGASYAIYYFVSGNDASTTSVNPSFNTGTPFPTAPTPPTTYGPTSTYSPTPPTPPTPPVYGINLVYATPVPSPINSAFDQAKAKWQTILIDPGVSLKPPAGMTLCDQTQVTYDGKTVVDDLEIWVDVGQIDGAGGVLGYAGPCGLIASGSFRSVTGEIVLDITDLLEMETEGILVDVIVHEIGHVLGLGTFWNQYYKQLVLPPLYLYTGSYGMQGYVDVGGPIGLNPPIELHGGIGTAYVHWSKSYFESELMTGYIYPGSTPLSKLSVEALEDLGYSVNVDSADPYTIPSGRRRLRTNHKAHYLYNDSLAFHKKKIYPIVIVDAE